MIGLKPTLITAGVGIAAVFSVYAMLVIEQGAHAKTKQALADEMGLVAELQQQQARTAGDRAAAIERALAQQRTEMDRQREQEERLRAMLAESEQLNNADRRDADARIARLKLENETLRLWAAGTLPDQWVDWMLEPATDQTAAVGP